MSAKAEFIDIPLEANNGNVSIEAQIDALRLAQTRFTSALTEAEELTILREFGNTFHNVNSMIKNIPNKGVRGDQSTATFIAESKTEIQKYTQLLAKLKGEFESIVKNKWQGRVKYPIDWSEPDAWYALITLSMNHMSAESRLAWDKIVDASVTLDSLSNEVGSVLDSILNLFGFNIKKLTSSSSRRSDEEIEHDKAIVTASGNTVTLPSVKVPAQVFSNKKKHKWIAIVLFFVAFSIVVITWFSRQYGGLSDTATPSDALNSTSAEYQPYGNDTLAFE